MMPTVAACVYCSQKIEEKEKSVNVPHLPGGVAHLACAQKVAIRTAPRRCRLAGISRFRRIPVSMGRSPVEQSGPLRPEGCTLQSDAEALAQGCKSRWGHQAVTRDTPLIDMCINNRHRIHKKAGNSEAVIKDRRSSGRFCAFLVIRPSAAMSSSRLSGRPLASVALKWVQTNSSGFRSGA